MSRIYLRNAIASLAFTFPALAASAQCGIDIPVYNSAYAGDVRHDANVTRIAAQQLPDPSVPNTTPAAAILPVLLNSFTGQVMKEGNLVSWTNGSEINTVGIELQRSEDGTDYRTISSFAPEGHGGSYRYMDASAIGRVYYRLKMLPISGDAEYSYTIKVERPFEEVFTSIYPTVISDGRLHIIMSTEQATVSIHNLNGQVMQTARRDERVDGGSFSMQLTLPAGTYVARITDTETGKCQLSTSIVLQ